MHLIPNWRRVLTRAWSSYALIAITALCLAETVFGVLGNVTGLPDVAFAVLYGLIAAGGLVARLTYQPSLHKGDDNAPTS